MISAKSHQFHLQLFRDWKTLLLKLLPRFLPQQQQQHHKKISEPCHNNHHQVSISIYNDQERNENNNCDNNHHLHQNVPTTFFCLHQQVQVSSIRALTNFAVFTSRIVSDNADEGTGNVSKRNRKMINFEFSINTKKFSIEWNPLDQECVKNDILFISSIFLTKIQHRENADVISNNIILKSIGITTKYFDYLGNSKSDKFEEFCASASLAADLLSLLSPFDFAAQYNVIDLLIAFPQSQDRSFQLLMNPNSPFSSIATNHIIEKRFKENIFRVCSDEIHPSSKRSSLSCCLFDDEEDEDEVIRESFRVAIKKASIKNFNKTKTGMIVIFSTHPQVKHFLANSNDNLLINLKVVLDDEKINSGVDDSSSSNHRRLIIQHYEEKFNSIFLQFSKLAEQYGIDDEEKEGESDDKNQNQNLRFVVGAFLYVPFSSLVPSISSCIESITGSNFLDSNSFASYQKSPIATMFCLLRQISGPTSVLKKFIDVIESRLRHQTRMTERCQRNQIFTSPFDSNNHGGFNNFINQEMNQISSTSSLSTMMMKNDNNNDQGEFEPQQPVVAFAPLPKINSSTSVNLPFEKFLLTSLENANEISNGNRYLEQEVESNNNYHYVDTNHDLLLPPPALRKFIPFGLTSADRPVLSSLLSSTASCWMYQFDKKFIICGFNKDCSKANSAKKLLQERNKINDNANEKQQHPYAHLYHQLSLNQFQHQQHHQQQNRIPQHPFLSNVALQTTFAGTSLLTRTTNNNNNNNNLLQNSENNKSEKFNNDECGDNEDDSHLQKHFFIMDQHAVSERGRLEKFRSLFYCNNDNHHQSQFLQRKYISFRNNNIQKKENSTNVGIINIPQNNEMDYKKILEVEKTEEYVIPFDDNENDAAMSVLIDATMNPNLNNSNNVSSSLNNNNNPFLKMKKITNKNVIDLALNFSSTLHRWGWEIQIVEIHRFVDDHNDVKKPGNVQRATFLRILSIPKFVLETFELLATGTEPMIEFLLYLHRLSFSAPSSSSSLLFSSHRNSNNNENFLSDQFLSSTAVPPLFDRFSISRSCRGAIMFNDELSAKDMKLIVKSVVGDNTSNQFDRCSHGRVSMKMLIRPDSDETVKMMMMMTNSDDSRNSSTRIIKNNSFVHQHTPYGNFI